MDKKKVENELTWTRLKKKSLFSVFKFSYTLHDLAEGSFRKTKNICLAIKMFTDRISQPDFKAVHTSYINCLLKINNNQVVSCSNDKTLKLWNIREGTLLGSFAGHQSYVLVVRRLNANLIASCSWDKTVKIWDLTTLKEVQTIIPGDSCVKTFIKYTPTSIICALRNGTISKHNFMTGLLDRVIVSDLKVNDLLHQKKSLLICGCVDKSLKVISLKPNDNGLILKKIFIGITKELNSLVKISNNSVAGITEEKSLFVYNLEKDTYTVAATFATGIRALLKLDSETLACAGNENKIFFVDLVNSYKTKSSITLPVNKEVNPTITCMTKLNGELVLANDHYNISLVNVEYPRKINETDVSFPKPEKMVKLSKDTLFTYNINGSFSLWNYKTGVCTKTNSELNQNSSSFEYIQNITIINDNLIMLSLHYRDIFLNRNLEIQKNLSSFSKEHKSLVRIKDNLVLYIKKDDSSHYCDDAIFFLVDTRTNKVVKEVKEKGTYAFKISKNRILVFKSFGRYSVFDLDEFKVKAEWQIDNSSNSLSDTYPTAVLLLNPNTLFIADSDSSFHIVDIDTGKRSYSSKLKVSRIRSATLVNSRLVAYGTEVGFLELFDIQNKSIVLSIKVCSSSIFGILRINSFELVYGSKEFGLRILNIEEYLKHN